MQLKGIQMGWKGLEEVINKLISAINGNEPIEGSGIRITDTKGGKLIELSASSSSGGGGSGGGGGGGQAQPHVLLDNIIWNGVKWEKVIVVDPVTCDQSTIMVLVQGAVTDYVAIPLAPNKLWATIVSA